MTRGAVRLSQHFTYRRSLGSALIHYAPLPDAVAAQLDADKAYLLVRLEVKFGADSEIAQALGLIPSRELVSA